MKDELLTALLSQTYGSFDRSFNMLIMFHYALQQLSCCTFHHVMHAVMIGIAQIQMFCNADLQCAIGVTSTNLCMSSISCYTCCCCLRHATLVIMIIGDNETVHIIL